MRPSQPRDQTQSKGAGCSYFDPESGKRYQVLTDLFPQKKKLQKVISTPYPDRDPEEVLESWAATVSKIR